jgi:patatin-like phospholipase/acyl hydrolase
MGGDVFKKHFWHRIKTLWGLFGPVFPASNIEPDLIEMLDHYQMKDLIRPCLFTAYDIDMRKATIFTNCDKMQKYRSYYVKDVVRGSTSIPAYFPPAYFQEGTRINTLVDGGVFANNPSLVAYIEASKCLFKTDDPKNLDPNKILVISLGTGASQKKQYPYAKAKKWGMVNWVFPIIDVMLSGISDVTHYEMKKIFQGAKRGDNYKRINPPLEYSTAPSTDASRENITNLIKDAKVYIEENKEFLNTLAREIIDINQLITFESMK